jgi:hypothetical protein
MSRHSREPCAPEWKVRSVSIRKRDAQHRLAQVFHVLFDGLDQPSTPDAKLDHPSSMTQQEEADARRYLCKGLDRASTTEPDH